MRRRDFLKSATIIAGANATAAIATAAPIPPARNSATGKPLKKIALEEHFMVPDFVGYFAETYPMFSVDYPFEKTDVAAAFIDSANLSETERINVASDNAKRILRLDRHAG